MNLAEQNPFETIKQTGDNGASFWSARDLMPLLGYDKWERFQGVIERAQLACNNSNIPSDNHILGGEKLVQRPQGGGNTREDFRLSRFGAYLVAMNGDPRKPEIAAAQQYFVVKTREAETRPVLPFNPNSPVSMLEYALTQAREAESAKTALALAAPKAEAFDKFINATGCYLVREAAKVLGIGQNRLYNAMRDNHIIFPDRNEPYQCHVDAGRFVVKARTFEAGEKGTRTAQTMYVTSKGVEYLRDRVLRGNL